MAKNLVCEVLTTVKGLDPKKPQEHIHAGTPDKPTLIELADNAATAGLIKAGVLRAYPGPQAISNLPESDKVRALQGKVAELEASLKEAGEAAAVAATKIEALKAALQAVAEAPDLEAAIKVATETQA